VSEGVDLVRACSIQGYILYVSLTKFVARSGFNPTGKAVQVSAERHTVIPASSRSGLQHGPDVIPPEVFFFSPAQLNRDDPLGSLFYR